MVGDGTLICEESEGERAELFGEGAVKPWAEKLTLWGMAVSETGGEKAVSMGWPGGYSLWRGTSTGGRTAMEERLSVK